MPDLDIVIVNYMSAAHTLNCVEAARNVARHDGVSIQVVVINNGDDNAHLSTDLTGDDVVLVDNTINVGFGRACNQGAKLGCAPIILFLNPDVTLQPDSLKACVNDFDSIALEGTGIIGPEITDEKKRLVPSCSKLPTATDLFLRSIGAHTVFRNTGYPYLPLKAHKESGPVGQVMGAALFIRRSVFDVLGGFDERYYLYYEDVDLCARARDAGFASFYRRGARVIHIGRASSSQDTGRALALHASSRITYARLHFGFLQQLFLTVTVLLVEFPIRTARACFGRGVLKARDMFRAYRLFVRGIFSGSQRQDIKTAPHLDKA